MTSGVEELRGRGSRRNRFGGWGWWRGGNTGIKLFRKLHVQKPGRGGIRIVCRLLNEDETAGRAGGSWWRKGCAMFAVKGTTWNENGEGGRTRHAVTNWKCPGGLRYFLERLLDLRRRSPWLQKFAEESIAPIGSSAVVAINIGLRGTFQVLEMGFFVRRIADN